MVCDGGDTGVGEAVDIDNHFCWRQCVKADVAVVVSFDNQPVRGDRVDLAVVVEVGFADVALAVTRDAVITAVSGDKPGAGHLSYGELTEHRFTANRLSDVHPQHTIGRDNCARRTRADRSSC